MGRSLLVDVAVREVLETGAYLARFRRKIRTNAAGWLQFIRQNAPETSALDEEMANLRKAIQQAVREPTAWEIGLVLVGEAWQYVEQRGYWLAWQDPLEEALQVSRRTGWRVHEASLLDQMGELARILGDNPRALNCFNEALAISRELDDRASVGRVLTHLSQIYLALA